MWTILSSVVVECRREKLLYPSLKRINFTVVSLKPTQPTRRINAYILDHLYSNKAAEQLKRAKSAEENEKREKKTNVWAQRKNSKQVTVLISNAEQAA